MLWNYVFTLLSSPTASGENRGTEKNARGQEEAKVGCDYLCRHPHYLRTKSAQHFSVHLCQTAGSRESPTLQTPKVIHLFVLFCLFISLP